MEFQRWLALHILNIHFQSQLLNYKADLKDVYIYNMNTYILAELNIQKTPIL